MIWVWLLVKAWRCFWCSIFYTFFTDIQVLYDRFRIPRNHRENMNSPRKLLTYLSWRGGKEIYPTLGPKLYIFSVLSPRICFCFINPYFLAGIAAFFESLLLAVSKQVLKPSGIFVRKFACDLGFAGYEIFGQKGPPAGRLNEQKCQWIYQWIRQWIHQ